MQLATCVYRGREQGMRQESEMRGATGPALGHGAGCGAAGQYKHRGGLVQRGTGGATGALQCGVLCGTCVERECRAWRECPPPVHGDACVKARGLCDLWRVLQRMRKRKEKGYSDSQTEVRYKSR